MMTTCVDDLRGLLRANNAHRVVSILHCTLARVEMLAPADVRAALTPVGGAFTIFFDNWGCCSRRCEGHLVRRPLHGLRGPRDRHASWRRCGVAFAGLPLRARR